MYAYFTASEANYLDYLKRQRAKQMAKPEKPTGSSNPADQRQPIEMGLANETGYPHHGFIDYADPTVDPNTGTILVRGIFDNPQPYVLAPGLFVRIRVPIGTQPDALLVPESALGTDQAGRYLLIVRPNNVVEHRSVTVGTEEGAMRVVEHGLKPNERFIVEGLQRAREGSVVKPVEAKPAAGNASSPGPSAGPQEKGQNIGSQGIGAQDTSSQGQGSAGPQGKG
jgi:membrane fusion protein (multidrug efflux system)